jgi:hypothetical protein
MTARKRYLLACLPFLGPTIAIEIVQLKSNRGIILCV